MLVNNREQLIKARNGYAILAIIRKAELRYLGCLQDSEEMQSPIILAHYISTGAYSGHDWFVEVAKWCANKVSVPVSIHLDHGDSF